MKSVLNMQEWSKSFEIYMRVATIVKDAFSSLSSLQQVIGDLLSHGHELKVLSFCPAPIIDDRSCRMCFRSSDMTWVELKDRDANKKIVSSESVLLSDSLSSALPGSRNFRLVVSLLMTKVSHPSIQKTNCCGNGLNRSYVTLFHVFVEPHRS